MSCEDLSESDNFYHDKYGYCYYSIDRINPPLIYGLYIEPEHRGRGHARRIIMIVIGFIRSAGFPGPIEIEVERNAKSGIDAVRLSSFYLRMGLSVINMDDAKP